MSVYFKFLNSNESLFYTLIEVIINHLIKSHKEERLN